MRPIIYLFALIVVAASFACQFLKKEPIQCLDHEKDHACHAKHSEGSSSTAKTHQKDVGTSSEKLEKVIKSEDEWKSMLSSLEYKVTRQQGTERAFTGKYWNNKEKGTYHCICCDLELFSSDTKYKSGTGWPSFYEPIEKRYIGEVVDRKFGMVRTEVICNRCDAHLGHVFNDGPQPTGLRYCINSASLKFKK